MILAAIALTNGFDERQETILAHMLGVTRRWGEKALTELLDRPDLAAMDRDGE